MGWTSVLSKWRSPVFLLFRVTWNFDLRIAPKVEVQKMLASLSPCLRQMVQVQKMLARVNLLVCWIEDVEKILASLVWEPIRGETLYVRP